MKDYRKLQAPVIIICLFVWALFSCKKEEQVFTFTVSPPPPPPPPPDTAISVTAKLNGEDFRAVGRALPPGDSMIISFYEPGSDGFLDIKLGSDTPGTYTLGRTVSKYTAVYFKSSLDRAGLKGYTSRATDDAGGTVVITGVDTLAHRIKGTFELLLLSRVEEDRYEFKEGAFDILYNYAEAGIAGKPLAAVTMNTGLEEEQGSLEDPAPYAKIGFPDSLSLTIRLLHFKDKGAGMYSGNDVDMQLTDQKTGKVFTYVSGQVDLLRYNYKEFLQAGFECMLKSADGEQRQITGGSLAIGTFR